MKPHPDPQVPVRATSLNRRGLLWRALALATVPIAGWTAARRRRRTEMRGGWIVASDDY